MSFQISAFNRPVSIVYIPFIFRNYLLYHSIYSIPLQFFHLKFISNSMALFSDVLIGRQLGKHDWGLVWDGCDENSGMDRIYTLEHQNG